jgi:hypothetical protein
MMDRLLDNFRSMSQPDKNLSQNRPGRPGAEGASATRSRQKPRFLPAVDGPGLRANFFALINQ